MDGTQKEYVGTTGSAKPDPVRQNHVSLLANAISSVSMAKIEANELLCDITEGSGRDQESCGTALNSVPSLAQMLNNAPDEIEKECAALRETLRSIREVLRV